MYEHEIKVTMQVTLRFRKRSYDCDDLTMEELMEEAAQAATSAVDIDETICSLEDVDVSSAEVKRSEYYGMDLSDVA